MRASNQNRGMDSQMYAGHRHGRGQSTCVQATATWASAANMCASHHHAHSSTLETRHPETHNNSETPTHHPETPTHQP
eukprot:192953-Chlamydomonas_euryale.AAC.1